MEAGCTKVSRGCQAEARKRITASSRPAHRQDSLRDSHPAHRRGSRRSRHRTMKTSRGPRPARWALPVSISCRPDHRLACHPDHRREKG